MVRLHGMIQLEWKYCCKHGCRQKFEGYHFCAEEDQWTNIILGRSPRGVAHARGSTIGGSPRLEKFIKSEDSFIYIFPFKILLVQDRRYLPGLKVKWHCMCPSKWPRQMSTKGARWILKFCALNCDFQAPEGWKFGAWGKRWSRFFNFLNLHKLIWGRSHPLIPPFRRCPW
jgi:hypothetical protein